LIQNNDSASAENGIMDNQTLPQLDLAKRQVTDAELQVYTPLVEDPGGLVDLPRPPIASPGSLGTVNTPPNANMPTPALTTR
jgi:hypothetical protein